MIKSYRDLIIWQKSMQMAKEVYCLCSELPKNESYGLISQLQRASVAIPSNIAEGYQRGTKEFVQFLSIAAGSLSELETQLLLIEEIYKKDVNMILTECDEVSKMLRSMSQKLRLKILVANPKPLTPHVKEL